MHCRLEFIQHHKSSTDNPYIEMDYLYRWKSGIINLDQNS
jgi:hypothetical protein